MILEEKGAVGRPAHHRRPRADPPSGAGVDARSAVRVDGHDQARPARAAVAHARRGASASAPTARSSTPLDEDAVAHRGAGPDRRRDRVADDRVPQRVREPGPRAAGARDRARARPGLPVSISSDLVSEYREYERTLTAVLNSYIQPQVIKYVDRLESQLRRAASPAAEHRPLRRRHDERAVHARSARSTSRSPGPSGGASGAAYLARRAGVPNVLTLRHGRDVDRRRAVPRRRGRDQARGAARLLPVPGPRGRHPQRRRRRRLDRLPEPRRRAQGRPAQRGRRPGPGLLRPRRRRSRRSPTPTSCSAGCPAARGSAARSRSTSTRPSRAVAKVARGPRHRHGRRRAGDHRHRQREHARGAARRVSVERGYDPRDFGLVAFGGAGPLHANALARLIGADPLIIPTAPGVLSAFGFLAADVQNEFARTYLRPAEDTTAAEDCARRSTTLVAEAREWLTRRGGRRGRPRRSSVYADCRYYRQDIQIPCALELDGADQRVRRARCAATSRASTAAATASTSTRRSRSPRCAWWAAASTPRPPRAPADRRGGRSRLAIDRHEQAVFDGESASTPDLRPRRSSRPGHRIAGPAIVVQEDSTVRHRARLRRRRRRLRGNIIITQARAR